ncbi:type II secretion system F family protein [Sporosarcina sp. Sa2YVA2]|uniref:Type II secretion system F family protein n=1 Tax=Sporosarcina quadrami TaxID=2762234 RepID=A0ABR8U577_9BACL|nr:competence type IV pilus assembly protein ComGB [Sporosarcina quadrami]MBD7983163.1 type II secretion system F family protein [Sporosarcina quadrami]
MIEHQIERSHKRVERIINRPAFLGRLAMLLKEGYTFHDGLILLLPYHSKNYVELLEQIETDLKAGDGVVDILMNLGFSSNNLLPIIISEVDGRLAEALEGVAERLKKAGERSKKLRNILLYPIVLFSFMAVLLVLFRNYFLPNLQALAITRNDTSTGFVSILPIIVSKIPDLMIIVGIIVLIGVAIVSIVYRKLSPSKRIRFFLRIPIAGDFFVKMKTSDFASELGSLLHSGLSMQDALDVLTNQQVDKIMMEIATTIKKHVIYGENLDQAILLTDGLSNELSSYALHGANAGHLPKELMIYSENLRERIEEDLSKWLSSLQPVLFTILAICILAAYLALLLPIYNMFDSI